MTLLVCEGVKHVIAIDEHEKILGSSVPRFVRMFYHKFLMEEKTLWDAFDAARAHLQRENLNKIQNFFQIRILT
eukprot:UN04503